MRNFAAFLLLAWVAAGALAQSRSPGQAAEYTFGSGDDVKVTVFGHEDLSGKFFVNEVGVISLPLVGDLKIGGRTVRQAQAAIENALKPDYLVNPRVNVQVMNYRPFYIIGEVNSPGSYPYVNGITVTEAVALAGGYTYRAKEKNVIILRATDAAREETPATDTTPVLPGDVIKVPERFF